MAEKDRWDKFQIVAAAIGSILLPAVLTWLGLTYKATENQRNAEQEQRRTTADDAFRSDQLKAQRVDLAERLIPRLSGTPEEQRVARVLIESLGDAELTKKIAATVTSKRTVAALKEIASDKSNESAALAVNALGSLATSASPLNTEAAIALTGLFANSRDSFSSVGGEPGKSLAQIKADDVSDMNPSGVLRGVIGLTRRGKGLTLSQYAVAGDSLGGVRILVRALLPPNLTIVDYDYDSDMTRFAVPLKVRNYVPQVGELVIAVGPSGSGFNSTAGRVSSIGENVVVKFDIPMLDLPGSALLDTAGNVIGMRSVIQGHNKTEVPYIRGDRIADFLRSNLPEVLIDRPAGLR